MIYLDNAATTPLHHRVKRAMHKAMYDYGNASTHSTLGGRARGVIETARAICAQSINADPSEIYFTSGGTESDNWAVNFGMTYGAHRGGSRFVTSAIEHKAILNQADKMWKYGMGSIYLPVGRNGVADISSLEPLLKTRTVALVSVMMVNNETGVKQPIKDIAKLCHKYGVLCHTDAVQAYGKIKIDVRDLGVDLLSVSAHKVHGPKGVGFMFCNSELPLEPFIEGGGQERGMRSGTENTVGIAGLGAAASSIEKEVARGSFREAECVRVIKLLSEQIPDFRLNVTAPVSFSTGILNFNVGVVDAPGIVMLLDNEGIVISNGSACDTERINPSHVLTAMGLPENIAANSFRVSFGGNETIEEVDCFVEAFVRNYERLKRIKEESNND